MLPSAGCQPTTSRLLRLARPRKADNPCPAIRVTDHTCGASVRGCSPPTNGRCSVLNTPGHPTWSGWARADKSSGYPLAVRPSPTGAQVAVTRSPAGGQAARRPAASNSVASACREVDNVRSGVCRARSRSVSAWASSHAGSTEGAVIAFSLQEKAVQRSITSLVPRPRRQQSQPYRYLITDRTVPAHLNPARCPPLPHPHALLGGDQRGAGTRERLVHRLARSAGVLHRPPHAPHRLLRAVHRLRVLRPAGDLPQRRLLAVTRPVAGATDGIPAGLVLPMVMTMAEHQPVLGPDHLRPDAEPARNQAPGHGGGVQGAVPDVGPCQAWCPCRVRQAEASLDSRPLRAPCNACTSGGEKPDVYPERTVSTLSTVPRRSTRVARSTRKTFLAHTVPPRSPPGSAASTHLE